MTLGLMQVTCGDPVPEFDGFIKSQVEYLLSGSGGKVWQLASRSLEGQEVAQDACEEGGAYIFVPDSRSDSKPLLFAYDPSSCDSLTFCNAFPGYCKSDTSICNDAPSLCEDLAENILVIGYWEVKKPVISNIRTDTVFLHLWDDTRIMHIDRITASMADFKYENTSSEILKESYIWVQPE